MLLMLCGSLLPGCDAAVTPSATRDPAQAYVRRLEAKRALRAGDWPACVAAYDAALTLGPEDELDAYNAACCLSRAGELEPGLQRLEVALSLGYRDLDRLKLDPDLEGLSKLPGWTPLLTAAEARYADAYVRQNAELRALYLADHLARIQAATLVIDSDGADADQARIARARTVLEAGGAAVAADYLHASVIFQRGSTLAEVTRARELALAALALDPGLRRARWAAAAAEDRQNRLLGRPQRFGTEVQNRGAGWELYPVDPATTDAERHLWDVPPLSEARARVDELNRGAQR